MLRRDVLLAVCAAIGLALVYWKTRTAPRDTASVPVLPVSDFVGGLVNSLTPFYLSKMLPANAGYVSYIEAVEKKYNMPSGLLVRLAWQECRFRNDIITGSVVSSAGAKGMFQLMPIHWAYVDPTDWQTSADYAGNMLARLYNRFGTWALALAAYNWGEGNLSKKGIIAAPTETKNYYNQILADVGQPVILA